MATLDARGTLTGWSDGARRLTGHPAEAVVGRPARDLLARRVPPEALTELSGTVVLRHRDGSTVALSLRGCPLLGAAGTPDGYAVTVAPPDEPALRLTGENFRQSSLAMSVHDVRQRCLRANDTAQRMLGVPEEDLIGRGLPEVMEETGADGSRFRRHLRQVADTGRSTRYEAMTPAGSRLGEHAWTIEMWPLRDASGDVTAVGVAGFETTEQHRTRHRLALLNEAATTIGTTLDVVRTAEELIDILVPRFTDFASVDLLDWVLGAEEPLAVPAEDVVLRRVAHESAATGLPDPSVRPGDTDVYPPCSAPARALREGRPVLTGPGDPDFDGWMRLRNELVPANRPFRDRVSSTLAVPLRARGTTMGVATAMRVTPRGPFAPDDIALAEELASRAAVCVDNARRFARERTTALALQHSLLPKGLPGQSAVEVAHRYLPSGSAAGIGGDWFDVIPLSGSRVALVVGDVVGHGIPSSATMGRLCTAVRTLADVDLPPEELLTHLDDLVAHLAAGSPRFSGPNDTSWATDAANSWSSGSCTTNCTVVRSRVSPARSYVTGRPSTVNCPAPGRSPPLSSRISVVLPLPLRPSSASARPSRTAKSRPLSTNGPSSYPNDAPRRATRAGSAGSFTTGAFPGRR
ncbi:PAS domain-containing protein [Streptomyces sp. SID5910]|nr:PAS domain-containing protein [Streptomyces sp. SID5910]